MTVQEYLDAPFDETVYIRLQKRRGRPCTGPDMIHLQWDIEHGFCELYSAALESGEANLSQPPSSCRSTPPSPLYRTSR